MSHPRRGITFTDVVILLVMLALLAPALARAVGRSRETAVRVRCGSNLRQIGQAILLYSNEDNGSYPRTLYSPGAPPTQYTAHQAPNPFAGGGPGPNDVTAALYLLLRTQDLTADVFVCPSTARDPWPHSGQAALKYSNFPDETVLSYSLANPYPTQTPANAALGWDNKLGADFAVAADMNPGKGGDYDAAAPQATSSARDMNRANTRNHQGAGQNVLYGDGHVEFQQNAFCGVKRDNIYTVSGGDDGDPPTSAQIAGAPRWAGDSVLLPVAQGDPPSYTARGNAVRRSLTWGVGVLIVAVIALFVILTRSPAGERE